MKDGAPVKRGPISDFEPGTTVRILASDEGQSFVARTHERNSAQRALDKIKARLGRRSEVMVDLLIPGHFVPFQSDDRGPRFGYFKSLEPSLALSPRVLAEEVHEIYYGRASEASTRGVVLLNRR